MLSIIKDTAYFVKCKIFVNKKINSGKRQFLEALVLTKLKKKIIHKLYDKEA